MSGPSPAELKQLIRDKEVHSCIEIHDLKVAGWMAFPCGAVLHGTVKMNHRHPRPTKADSLTFQNQYGTHHLSTCEACRKLGFTFQDAS